MFPFSFTLVFYGSEKARKECHLMLPTLGNVLKVQSGQEVMYKRNCFYSLNEDSRRKAFWGKVTKLINKTAPGYKAIICGSLGGGSWWGARERIRSRLHTVRAKTHSGRSAVHKGRVTLHFASWSWCMCPLWHRSTFSPCSAWHYWHRCHSNRHTLLLLW